MGIITVAQQKGGSGKTTIAANLALHFANKGQKTALLDTDPQGSVGRWFVTRQENYPQKEPSFTFKTASAWGARLEARELIKDNSVVVIDTPPKMGIDGRPAIEVADLVVVPVSASALDVWATEPTIELAKMEKKPVLLVLNRISTRTKLGRQIEKHARGFGCDVARQILGNRVHFAETIAVGLGVEERGKSMKAAKEFSSLGREISKILSVNH